MISLQIEVTAKGASVLYETLKDSKTAYSEEPEHAAFMYANNKEGITGTFFDYMRQDVRSVQFMFYEFISFRVPGHSKRGTLGGTLMCPGSNNVYRVSTML